MHGPASTPLGVACGSELPSPVLTKVSCLFSFFGNQLIVYFFFFVKGDTRVKFISDGSLTGKGFHLRYEIQSCGGLITEDLTEIRSPTRQDLTGIV